jgi:hypothetical protein
MQALRLPPFPWGKSLDSSRNWGGSAAEPRFHLDFRRGLLGKMIREMLPVSPLNHYINKFSPIGLLPIVTHP